MLGVGRSDRQRVVYPLVEWGVCSMLTVKGNINSVLDNSSRRKLKGVVSLYWENNLHLWTITLMVRGTDCNPVYRGFKSHIVLQWVSIQVVKVGRL